MPPKIAFTKVRQAARYMRWELETSWLEVVLIPSRDPEMAARGGMIRVAVSQNACWYQSFCRDHLSGRKKPRRRMKPDTLIRRRHTLRALREIESGRAATIYAQRLLPYIENYYRRVLLPIEERKEAMAV